MTNNTKKLNDFILEMPLYIKESLNYLYPGPLTIIFKKNNKKNMKYIGTKDTIGIRIPDHKLIKNIIEITGPLICTSANISGEKNAKKISDINKDLLSNLNLIIDGGTIEDGLPSTILDVTKYQPQLLRIGKIKKEDIENIINMNIIS